MNGGRRQGPQNKRWDDNIKDWTSLEFAKSQGAEEKREKWRKLVVKLSVVPQRPLRIGEEEDEEEDEEELFTSFLTQDLP